jgi:hypothetical protein
MPSTGSLCRRYFCILYFLQGATVVDRHYLDEFRQVVAPVLQDMPAARTVGVMHMPFDQLPQAPGVMAGQVMQDIDQSW